MTGEGIQELVDTTVGPRYFCLFFPSRECVCAGCENVIAFCPCAMVDTCTPFSTVVISPLLSYCILDDGEIFNVYVQ